MQFDGAIIREQNVTFAIIVVKPHVLNSSSECNYLRQNYSVFFPSMPIILMSQDSRGTPTYQGKKDIVNFLAHIHPSRIQWKTYTFS